MKRIINKFAFVLVLSLIFSAVIGLTASAESDDGGDSAEVDFFAVVTDRINDGIDQVKNKVADVRAWLSDKLADNYHYITLGMAVILLLEIFFCYHILKVNTYVFGLFFGFIAGLIGYGHLSALMKMPGDFVKWIIAGLIAIICGFLFTWLNKIVIVLAFTVFTFLKFSTFTDNRIVQCAVTAAALVLSILLFKYIFMAGSAYFSAKAALGLIHVLGTASLPIVSSALAAIDPAKLFPTAPDGLIVTVLAVVLALLGFISQFALYRRKKAKRRDMWS